MPADAHKNFAYSTVAVAPVVPDVSGSLTAQAGDGARFPTPPFNLIVCPAGQQPLPGNSEIARVSDVTGDVLSFSARHVEGSNPRMIQVGDQIFAGPTAKSFTDIEAMLLLTQPPAIIQPGVLLPTDCALTVNSSSQVSVAAAPLVWTPTTDGPTFPMMPFKLAATVLAGIPATATYTRLDQIVVDPTGAIVRVAGIETNGVTLANRTGAIGVAGVNSIRLYDILVTTAGVLAANVRDRRPWARGAFARQARQSTLLNIAAGNYAYIDSVNLSARIECSGGPVRLRLAVPHVYGSAGGGTVYFAFDDSGSGIDGMNGVGVAPSTANNAQDNIMGQEAAGILVERVTIASAGSHLFRPLWAATGQAMNIPANAVIEFTVEEILKTNANNGTS